VASAAILAACRRQAQLAVTVAAAATVAVTAAVKPILTNGSTTRQPAIPAIPAEITTAKLAMVAVRCSKVSEAFGVIVAIAVRPVANGVKRAAMSAPDAEIQAATVAAQVVAMVAAAPVVAPVAAARMAAAQVVEVANICRISLWAIKWSIMRTH